MDTSAIDLSELAVDPAVMAKWQGILDLVAKIIQVPAALIMKAEAEAMRVLIASNSPGNPYSADALAPNNSGYYCETVMATRRPLVVPNALADPRWQDNPNVPLGMISYMGYPLRWPDGRMFGTMCLLDRHENSYDPVHAELLEQFRDVVEQDLLQIWHCRQRKAEDAALMQQIIVTEKMATVGRLVTGIAHELNTPLGNIVLSASTLADRIASVTAQLQSRQLTQGGLQRLLEEARAACQMIERNSGRAGDLIASFKQIAVDQDAQERRLFKLEETVRNIATAMGPMLNRGHVELCTDIQRGLTMDSYPGHVEQVLAKLIDNSLAHAFDGRGERRITISGLLADHDTVELVYQDNGCGIPPEELPRVFDPFYTTRVGEGAQGLGLAIVLNVVQAILHGTVRLDSAADAGVRFTFRLPVNPAAK
ncbi:ATP-binding protein [Pseudoduganella sp. RAF53_2]|uniref:ATP-binding protein n=1 Tax=unclassified Pseudoduganella TaxID=2637179 RepID=UPI003F9A200B